MSYIKIQNIDKDVVETPEKGYIYFGYDSGGLWIKNDDPTQEAYYILNGLATIPSISSFTPANGAFNGETINIFGSNFIPLYTSVTFNGILGTGVNVSGENQLSVIVPDVPGDVFVIVTTRYGGSSNPVSYSISHRDLIPVIQSILPTTAPIGTDVSIVGYNFLGDTITWFGGTTGVTTVTSPTTLTATIPLMHSGQTIVFLETSIGQGNIVNFTVIDNTNPTITNFYPTWGFVGDTISISGTNFAIGQIPLHFGGVYASGITVYDSHFLTAVIANDTPFGSTLIRLAGSSMSGFTVSGYTTGLLPTISSVLPLDAFPGDTVTITGTNLIGDLTVTFSSVPVTVLAQSSSISTDIKISGVIPGINTVIVTNQYGSSARFDYLVSIPVGIVTNPIITSFNPTSALKGSAVNINGSNFVTGAGNAVYYGNVIAVVSNNATSVLVKTQISTSSQTGSVDVKIVNANGSYTKSGFLVLTSGNVPVITKISPVFGKAGDTIHIYGQYLTNGVVGFGTTYPGFSNSAITINDGHLQTTLPSGLVESGKNKMINVFVSTTNGTYTYSPFDVYAVPIFYPTITSFVPTSGPVGTFVTVYGTYFVKYWTDISVYIGGNYYLLDNQVYVSSTEVTGFIPDTQGFFGSALIRIATQVGTTQKGVFTIIDPATLITTTTTTASPTTTTTTASPTTTTTSTGPITSTTTTTFAGTTTTTTHPITTTTTSTHSITSTTTTTRPITTTTTTRPITTTTTTRPITSTTTTTRPITTTTTTRPITTTTTTRSITTTTTTTLLGTTTTTTHPITTTTTTTLLGTTTTTTTLLTTTTTTLPILCFTPLNSCPIGTAYETTSLAYGSVTPDYINGTRVTNGVSYYYVNSAQYQSTHSYLNYPLVTVSIVVGQTGCPLPTTTTTTTTTLLGTTTTTTTLLTTTTTTTTLPITTTTTTLPITTTTTTTRSITTTTTTSRPINTTTTTTTLAVYSWYVSHSQTSTGLACAAPISGPFYTLETGWNSLNRFFYNAACTIVYTGETLGQWVGYNLSNTTPIYSATIFNTNGDLQNFTLCSSVTTTTTTTMAPYTATWYVSHKQTSSLLACSATISGPLYTTGPTPWNSINNFFTDPACTIRYYDGQASFPFWVGYNSTNTTPVYSAQITNTNGDLTTFTAC